MLPTLLLLGALAVTYPPLTAEQRTRLETAQDGRDHREEAFTALLENARAASPASPAAEDAPPAVGPAELDRLLAAPDDHRAEVVAIEGVLQQDSALTRPFADVREWFVRLDGGRPVLVYVVAPRGGGVGDFRAGQRVAIGARFYKRVDAEARDGRAHVYPAFVAAYPERAPSGGAPAASFRNVYAPLALLLFALAGALLVLVVLARRARARGPTARRRPLPPPPPEIDVDERAPLPDDPAEALAELRRRADRGAR